MATPTKKRRTKKKRITKATAPPRENLEGLIGWPWPLRSYQQKVEDKFQAGIYRHLLVWHRRAGKDVFCLQKARQDSMKRVGGYVHFYPKHNQAKRAIWRGVDPKTEKRFVDTAFGDITVGRDNQELFLEFANGSTWQLLGSDNYNRVVGSNIVGAAFSEWALCDPRALDYIRPIIRENNGWIIFITTYRGRNHAWQMVQRLKNNPEWYVDVRTVLDTTDVNGNRIITDADIEKERRDGMSEAAIQQEYFCNPEAISDGAVYGKQIDRLRADKSRRCALWDPRTAVYAVWRFDLPIYAACLYVQPAAHGAPAKVLDAKIWNFVTLGEAVAECYRQSFPIQHHLISGDQAEMLPLLHDLRIHPDVLQRESGGFIGTSATAAFLEAAQVSTDADLFLDAIGGYARPERFQQSTATLVYGDDPAQSWHEQLAIPLETYCTWDYHGGTQGWSKQPDYAQQDRAARILI